MRVSGATSGLFHGNVIGRFLGQLTLAGNQLTSCLLGSRDAQTAGGIIDLQAAATLTVSPGAGQPCRFDGVLIGPKALDVNAVADRYWQLHSGSEPPEAVTTFPSDGRTGLPG